MNRLKLALIVSLPAMLAAGLWERAQIGTLREDNRHLRPLAEEAARLESEIAQLQNLQAYGEVKAPSFSKSELLQLRDEVAKARANSADLDRLLRENLRLAGDLESLAKQPMRLSEIDNYVPSEAWIDSGFASPEATLQTFCAAIERGDLVRIAHCLGDQEAKSFDSIVERDDEVFNDRTLKHLRSLTQSKGYRITGTHTNDAGHVAFGLQVSPRGIVMEMVMRRVEADWKIIEAFRPAKTPDR